MQIITFDEIIGLSDLIALFRITGIFDMNGAGSKNEVAGTLELFAHTKSLSQAGYILYLVESGHCEDGYFIRMVQLAINVIRAVVKQAFLPLLPFGLYSFFFLVVR